MALKINRWQASIALEFEVYRDKAKEWCWRLVAPSNGRILATSGEGYKRKSTCIRIMKSVRDRIALAGIIVQDARTRRWRDVTGGEV